MESGKPLSQRAFAKTLGVSHVAVSVAIRKGRIVRGVNADKQITDPELARADYLANTDRTDAPHAVVEHAARLAAGETPPPVRRKPAPDPFADDEEDEPLVSSSEPLDLADAARNEKHWKAKLAELKFREAARELVPAAEVSAKVSGKILACRTRLLGIASRAKQAIPDLSLTDVAALEGIVREALEELAE